MLIILKENKNDNLSGINLLIYYIKSFIMEDNTPHIVIGHASVKYLVIDESTSKQLYIM